MVDPRLITIHAIADDNGLTARTRTLRLLLPPKKAILDIQTPTESKPENIVTIMVFNAGELAKLQLQAYNARDIEAFLKCFDETNLKVSHIDATNNNDRINHNVLTLLLPSYDVFQTRYKTVFENSPNLKAVVSSRTVLRGPNSGRSWAIDLEHYSGLHKPVGEALDGSTGISSEPQSAYIIVMYQQATSNGRIDEVWMGEIPESLFNDPTKQRDNPNFEYLMNLVEELEDTVMIPDQILFWMGGK